MDDFDEVFDNPGPIGAQDDWQKTVARCLATLNKRVVELEVRNVSSHALALNAMEAAEKRVEALQKLVFELQDQLVQLGRNP